LPRRPPTIPNDSGHLSLRRRSSLRPYWGWLGPVHVQDTARFALQIVIVAGTCPTGVSGVHREEGRSRTSPRVLGFIKSPRTLSGTAGPVTPQTPVANPPPRAAQRRFTVTIRTRQISPRSGGRSLRPPVSAKQFLATPSWRRHAPLLSCDPQGLASTWELTISWHDRSRPWLVDLLTF